MDAGNGGSDFRIGSRAVKLAGSYVLRIALRSGHCRERIQYLAKPPELRIRAFWVEQFHARRWPNKRHKIIRNRLALLRDESVSGVTVGTAPTPTGDPLMRIYIIGKDGITLCRKAPATVNDGEIAVASNEELHAAPLSAKRRTSATSENKGRWQWQPGSARVSSRRTGFTSGIWRRGKGRHSQGRERLQSAPSRTLIGNTRFFPPAPWALT